MRMQAKLRLLKSFPKPWSRVEDFRFRPFRTSGSKCSMKAYFTVAFIYIYMYLSLSLSLRLAYGPHPKYSNTGYLEQCKLLQSNHLCSAMGLLCSDCLKRYKPQGERREALDTGHLGLVLRHWRVGIEFVGLADLELRGVLRCRAKTCNEMLHRLVHSIRDLQHVSIWESWIVNAFPL